MMVLQKTTMVLRKTTMVLLKETLVLREVTLVSRVNHWCANQEMVFLQGKYRLVSRAPAFDQLHQCLTSYTSVSLSSTIIVFRSTIVVFRNFPRHSA